MDKSYETTFSYIPQTLMGVIRWDKNFTILDLNPAAEKIFGYTKAEAHGLMAMDFLVPENAKDKVRMIWDDLFMKKAPNISINENFTSDGRKIICEWFNTPLIDDEDNFVGVSSMVQDITERKITEIELESLVKERTAKLYNLNEQLQREILEHEETKKSLLEISKRNSAILEAIPDVLVVLSRDGTYIDIKAESQEAHLAIPADKLIGMNIRDIGLSEHYLEENLQCIEKVFLTGKRQAQVYELNTLKGLRLYNAVIVPLNENEILSVIHDITEQRTAEKALKDGKEKYRRLIDNIPGVIWESGSDGEFRFISKNVEKIFGCTFKEAFKGGKRFWEDRLHPDDAESVKEAFTLLYTKGKKLDIEYRFRKNDDGWIWLHDKSISIFKNKGVVSAIGIFSDITREKELEVLTQKQNHALRQQVKELNCLYGLSSLKDKKNLSEDELISGVAHLLVQACRFPEITCCRILIDGRDFKTDNFRESPWKQIGEIRVEGEVYGSIEVFYLEEKLEVYEGTFLEAERHLIEVLCARLGRVIEHNRAKKALKISEERFLSFMEHFPGTASIKDTKGCYLYYNHVFADSHGIGAKEWIGKGAEEVFTPELASTIKTENLKLISEGLPLEAEKSLNKEGREYFYLNTKFPIFDENDEIESIGSIWTDTSHLKQTQKELETAIVTADAANRAKSTFLANMSHELRTPLNAILGFSQLLELKGGNLDTGQLKFISYIREGSDHLLEMVNDILDLAKIESGKFEINKKPFQLSLMLSRLPSAVNSLAVQKNIKLLADLDITDEIILADEVRLKQVLYNLLSNAIKFTPSGKKIGIRAQSRDNDAIIEVWDEGIGLKEEDLEKAFEPFEQVGKTSSEGTGLGLAISRKLIELHGGKLIAERRAEGGIRFIIYMPGIIPSESKEINEPIAEYSFETPIQSGSRNILVIEDNLINQEFIKEILMSFGYSAQIEGSGRGGIEAALNGDFDLILMDIRLPDIDGTETMKRIRENGKRRIPIVALTAYAMKGDEEKYMAEGFDGYISKPISFEHLRETIESLVEVKQT